MSSEITPQDWATIDEAIEAANKACHATLRALETLQMKRQLSQGPIEGYVKATPFGFHWCDTLEDAQQGRKQDCFRLVRVREVEVIEFPGK